MTRDQARARVAVGAALLDKERPGWAEAIDLGKLHLKGDCQCILGQLEGSYNAAIKERWPLKRTWRQRLFHPKRPSTITDERIEIAIKHGFDYEQRTKPFGDMFNEPLLREAWLVAIADRVLAVSLAQDAHSATVSK